MTQHYQTEAIAPQFDRRFSTDLLKAVQSVYDHILSQTTLEGENPIIRSLKQLTLKDRSKLMIPVQKVIEDHLHLSIKPILLTMAKAPIAKVSTSDFHYLDNTPASSIFVKGWLKKHPDAYYKALKEIKTLMSRGDRKKGILPKGIKDGIIDVCFVLPAVWFEELRKGTITVKDIVGIILHEVGHITDLVTNGATVYHVSSLSDEVLDFQRSHPDTTKLRDLLTVYQDIIKHEDRINPHVKPYILKDLKLLLESKVPDNEADTNEYYSAAFNLAEICAGQIAISVGKTSDIAYTTDLHKQSERVADRYSVMAGSAYGNDNLWYKTMYTALSRNGDQKSLRRGLLMSNGRQGAYDDFLDRSERILKEQYSLFREIGDEDPSVIKDYLRDTQDVITRLERLRSDIKKETWVWDFLKGIARYGYRAITLPFLRDRFEQDEAIHQQLHALTHHPLHYHLQDLKHGGNDA